MAAQDAQEDIESSARLLYDITAQMLSFGPVLATKMSFYSTLSLPWGLGAAGAETVKRGVDTDNADGVAVMTASMVKLGLLGTVHDIVVSLCNQDRADAVAAVTASLLAQGEVVVVTRITNALVASGHSEQAATISGELISQGNTQIYEVVKEAGLNMGLLSGESSSKNSQATDGRAGTSGNEVIEGIKEQGAQLLEKVTPPGSAEEPGKGEESKKVSSTPDADALFSDWSGGKSGEKESKEDRLL